MKKQNLNEIILACNLAGTLDDFIQFVFAINKDYGEIVKYRITMSQREVAKQYNIEDIGKKELSIKDLYLSFLRLKHKYDPPPTTPQQQYYWQEAS